MKHFLNLMRNFFASVLALIMAFIPFSGGKENKSEGDVRLKVAMVSDVHIDRRLPVGQLALMNCYEDMKGFSPDAIAVLGDLTNYGDYATTERFFQITKEKIPAGIQPIIIPSGSPIMAPRAKPAKATFELSRICMGSVAPSGFFV